MFAKSVQSEKFNLKKIEETLGVKFKNRNYIEEALTHRSFLNEAPDWRLPHNERLEFLGDAVLELIVTEFLFAKFPNYQEGQMTSVRAALVNHVMLSKVANELNLEEHILLSKGEAKDSSARARSAILSNAMEAVIGAVHLDQGYEVAKKFVTKNILKHLNEILSKELFIDSKSQLQEIVQETEKVTPTYKILRETGPDHDKKFISGVFFGDRLVAEGAGFSKQEAERNAAAAALKKIIPKNKKEKSAL